MRKQLWRVAGAAALILLAVLAYCGYRILWGKPLNINLLANRHDLNELPQ